MKLPPAPAAPLSPAGGEDFSDFDAVPVAALDVNAVAAAPPADDGWASFESAPVAVPPPPTFDTAPETAARDVGSFDAGFGAEIAINIGTDFGRKKRRKRAFVLF